jgi:hypothetical protein
MNVNGFWNKTEARKISPAVSRPDLVAARNAPIRGAGDLRPHERAPIVLSRTPNDNRVFCYRPDGTCYAVLSPYQWQHLRDMKHLESWLTRERESGIVIIPGQDKTQTSYPSLSNGSN